MLKRTKHFYNFGHYRLDASQRILVRDGKHIPLQPKTFETLIALVKNHGSIVEKEELMRLIWPDTFVEDVNLAKNISTLRKLLGESEESSEYIQTIPKRGYRFAAEVREVIDSGNDDSISQSNSGSIENLINQQIEIHELQAHRWVKAASLLIITALVILTIEIHRRPAQGNGLVTKIAGQKCIAVLPFHQINVPGEHNIEVTGLTEALISHLSGVEDLNVHPLNDFAKFDQTMKDPAAIGRVLKIDLIIDGSVRYSGDHARISVRIIRQRDGSQAWSQDFDYTLGSEFAIQDQISSYVASALRFEISNGKTL